MMLIYNSKILLFWIKKHSTVKFVIDAEIVPLNNENMKFLNIHVVQMMPIIGIKMERNFQKMKKIEKSEKKISHFLVFRGEGIIKSPYFME